VGLGFALFGLSAIEATALSLWLLTPEMGPVEPRTYVARRVRGFAANSHPRSRFSRPCPTFVLSNPS